MFRAKYAVMTASAEAWRQMPAYKRRRRPKLLGRERDGNGKRRDGKGAGKQTERDKEQK
jgi:hypothetical protein